MTDHLLEPGPAEQAPPGRTGRSTSPPRNPGRRNRLLYLAFALFLAAAAWALFSRRHDLAKALDELSWPSIVGSVAFGFLAVGAMLASWLAALHDSGVGMPLRDAARVYCVGQVGKYIPGSVWPVLTQARLARRRGASPMRVASGSLLALAISVCVSLVFGGLLLPFSDHKAASRLWWVAIVAVPLVVLLHPALLNRLLALAARVLRRGDVNLQYSLRGILHSAGWALLGNLLFGVHIFFLAHNLGAPGIRGYLLSACAYALASGVGVVIIFMPAGAGAREAVLTAVLAPVLTVDAALVVALVSRAVLVVVDVSLGLSQLWGLRHWSVPDDVGEST